jgi:hypothetical protein
MRPPIRLPGRILFLLADTMQGKMGFALFYSPYCLDCYSGLRFFRCGGGLDGSNDEDVIFASFFASFFRFFAGSDFGFGL